MSNQLPKILSIGLGAVLIASALLPTAAQAKPGKGGGPKKDQPPKQDKPVESVTCGQTELGVLSNFCEFRDGNDDGYGLSGTLDWLDGQSPTGWEKFFKVDSASGSVSKEDVDLNVYAGGTWDMNFSELLDLGYSEFAVAVKGGQDHAIYGYDTTDFVDGATYDWSTKGLVNNGGQQPGLSHFTVYVKRGAQEPGPEPVPEPMSILGLVAFGGGAIALKRRRQSDL